MPGASVGPPARGFAPRELARGTFAALYAGLRALVLVPTSRLRLAASPASVVLLTLAVAVGAAAVQYAQAGPDGEFASEGLPGFIFPFVLVTVAALTSAALAGNAAQCGDRIALGLGALFWLDLAVPLLLAWPALNDGLAGLFPDIPADLLLKAIWLCAALAPAWAVRAPRPLATLAVSAVALALFVALPLATVPLQDAIYAPPDTPAQAADSDAVVSQELLYREPELLTQSLNAIQAPSGTAPNLYFVGVAGSSAEDVFMKEVESVESMFRTRFAGPGHTMLLINNPATSETVPLATTVALESALKRVGSVMNRDRDILFLYLSSHGSADHRFTLEMPPLALDDLEPATLRNMLDAAGIRNRVIVVSACYSGGFIEPLANEHTLVITAAAADRSSFGCSNEEDFTYFGRAYFDEALRHTDSFSDAFMAARPRIAARESAQGFTPSKPQLSEGSDIRAVLSRYQTALEEGRAGCRGVSSTAACSNSPPASSRH